MTTRRAALASLAGLAVFAGTAKAQGRSIGEIRVDLSALRAGGWGSPPMQVIDSSLRRSLQEAFADRLGGGPTLIVRVTAIQLAGFPGLSFNRGSSRGGGGSGGDLDYMDGELILAGRGNTIIARQPLLSTNPAGTAGAWWREDGELRRLAALASGYGYWARRQLG